MRLTIDPAIVASNFAPFQANASLHESAQLFAKGMPMAEMIQALAMNRNVLSCFAAFERVYPHGNLERALLEKVMMCLSLRNRCQFCVDSHREITQRLGFSVANADTPEALEHSPRERLAIEYAQAIHRNSNQVSSELFSRLHDTFTDPEIVELTFLIGFINLLNWFNNALEVRYRSDFVGLDVA